MTLEESKLTLVKDVSKYLNSLFVLLSVIGAYVLARGAKAALSSKLKTNDDPIRIYGQTQLETHGLVFEYGAMSLFWPIILLGLSFSCLLLLRKYKTVNNGDDASSSLGMSDPLYHWQAINAGRLGRTLSGAMAWLPFFATLVHLVSGAYILWHIADPEPQSMDVAPFHLKALLLVQTIVASVSLIALFGISRQMVRIMRSLQ